MDKLITHWLEENFPKESTRNRYSICLKRFLSHIHEKNIRDIKTGQEMDRLMKAYVEEDRDFKSDLKNFVQAMQEEGLAPKTQNLIVNVVKIFMEEEGGKKIEDIEWKKIRKRFLPKNKAVTRNTYLNKEELRKIFSHLTAKGKSLFLFLLSSGARIGETLRLRVEDLDLDADPPKARIRSEHAKNDIARTVYFSCEARDAIEEWLKIKEDQGKKTRKIYRNGADGAESEGRSGEPEAETYGGDEVWPMSDRNARKMWNNALEKVGEGLDEKSSESGIRIFHLHTTRKFFKNNLDAKEDIIRALAGHEGYLDEAYGPSERDKESAYKEAMGSVTIFGRDDKDVRGEANRTSLNAIVDFLKALGVPREEIAQKLSGLDSRFDNGNGFENPVDEDSAKKIRKQLLSLASEIREEDSAPSSQRIVEPDEARELVNGGEWTYLDSLENGDVVVEEVS